ncbi:S-adenosylmethionine-dependent protein [Tubulinosema ratisbonensis]|uniref:tRNA (guanine-N(7)-)-methyltransferase n=1 Tax=Tubulinosema ratisbonensis TaxID=291195 RepID=A0A437AQ64_9MICR|nr:S-adenosylmethionine-dependent protein [Tubulinosema ratisbonensis]
MNNPKKKDFRPRAHANPFGDVFMEIPENPEVINWNEHFDSSDSPNFIDIGCGYGRFLIELSEKYKNKQVCGLELRSSVALFAKKKIEALNIKNACVFHTNAMFFLPNFFKKNSLEKIFILFPDPHFKKKKQKARIVCYQMTHIFDYLLKDEGKIYISTDVEELFEYMCESFINNKVFRRLSEMECLRDDIYEMTFTRTDESTRAAVKTGKTFATIFEKIKNF